MRLAGALGLLVLLGALLAPGPAWAAATPAPAPLTRRPFAVQVGGAPVLAGIAYGPYRQGQRPGGPDPSPEQILEDLQIIAARWGMIRLYSSRGPAETILRTIRDHDLPIRVLLGAWIAPAAAGENPAEENPAEENAAEVQAAITLARAYPQQVVAVSVGNETQVGWSGHRSPLPTLLGHLRTVRAAIEQPVSTADDYNFWNKPEAQELAREVDFLLLHAYAMWNRQSLAQAVPWTEATVASIRALHPELPIVLGETGWATALNPEGEERKQIVAPAGEAEQAVFYAELSAWAAGEGLPWFWFEAFDEPWKGSEDPREVEKHWGLYDVDRAPKRAVSGGKDGR